MKLKVVGLDPSLSNLGMVKGDLDINSGLLSNIELKLIETKPPSKRLTKQVRKNSIDLDRSRLLHKGMHEFIQEANLVFVEAPVGSQTARAMASYGICIGVLSSINKPLFLVLPHEVKIAACNKKTATKQNMIDWATNLYPNLNWFRRNFKGQSVLTSKNEHLADALASIYAGVKTEQFKEILTMYKQTIGENK